jgi:hypothetical protein
MCNRKELTLGSPQFQAKSHLGRGREHHYRSLAVFGSVNQCNATIRDGEKSESNFEKQ